jgi:uroporphyrin-3 C-methyltransferase
MSAELQPAENTEPQDLRQEPPRRFNPIWIFAIIIIAVVAWQWYDTRNQITDLQHELAKRLADADALGKGTQNLATEATESGRRLDTKLSLLEAKLAESQSQQLAMEALYQELTRTRDEATLEEVEQLLLIANQQLQLASNVKAALIAMQEADARLQRIDRPQLAPLRKILSKDMDVLNAAPYLDTVGISLRLDNLAAAVDALPLAMELRPPEPGASEHQAPATESVWLRFAREMWEDMKRLVRIQHMDKPDIPLLSPSQAYFLRENLKLRLLSARLALLARDGASFNADIDASLDWIGRYYDNKSRPTVAMLEALHQLRASEVGIELPRISASLDAVRNYRLARDRGNR